MYIGITCNSVERRWGKNGKEYLRKRNDGTYMQPKFANAIVKYGWDNFEHIIWATGLTHETACEIEQKLIALWDSRKSGYNISTGGEGNTGFSPSEETRKKMSIAHKRLPHKRGYSNVKLKGRKLTEEHKKKISESRKGKNIGNFGSKNPNYGNHKLANENNPNAKKCICLFDGKIYDCMNACSAEMGIHRMTLTKLCQKNKGFMYYEEWKSLSEVNQLKLLEQNQNNFKSIFYDHNAKRIINIDTLQTFSSCKEAAETYDAAPTHISRSCRQNNRTVKGYHFMYYDEWLSKNEAKTL